jgi:hypothetical protein
VTRFEIDLPARFERVEAGDVQLAARTPEPDPGGFHANLTVIVERLPEGWDLDRYADESLEQHERALEAFRTLDREATTLAGGPAVRTLGHHAAGGRALVLEQWRLVRGDAVVTVSTTCPALDWPAAAGVLAASAESLRFPA